MDPDVTYGLLEFVYTRHYGALCLFGMASNKSTDWSNWYLPNSFRSTIPIQLQFAIISQPIDLEDLSAHSQLSNESEELELIKKLLDKNPASRFTVDEALEYIKTRTVSTK